MSDHSDDERFESDRAARAREAESGPGEQRSQDQDQDQERDRERGRDQDVTGDDARGPDGDASADGDGVPRYRRELPAEVAAEDRAADESPRTPVHHAPDGRKAEEPSSAERPDGHSHSHRRSHDHGHSQGQGPSVPEKRETGRSRLVGSLWPPRLSRAQLIVAVLLAGLGFGLAVQVASTTDNSALRGARQEDLVRILDELDDRTQRLDDEKRRLENQRTGLENSSDQAEEARRQTLERERQLGILAGTVAAEGPGITVTVEDPEGTVEADMLLDAVQELRAAGAEAIQINDVRVVADTYLSDATGGGVAVDGNKISAPYRFQVIGKPEDLGPALNIPGGVVQTLEKEQAEVTVEDAEKVVVNALRRAERPDYARPSSR